MEGYPKPKFRFQVTIDNADAGGFSEVSGLDASIDPIEYREGNMKTETPMRVAGLRKYSNVTLKKGVITGKAFYDWIVIGLTGEVKQKEVVITLVDEKYEKVLAWHITKAWPTKYTAPDFNATSNEIAIESLELVHEGMTVE